MLLTATVITNDCLWISLTVLSWHLQGYRWASADHPWSRSGTWSSRGLSRVYLLLWWPSSWGTTTSSKGKPSNTSSLRSQNPTNIIICVISLLSVPDFDSMGWQGSLGTNWYWKKLWKFRFCWRLHCPSQCWTLPPGTLSLSLSIVFMPLLAPICNDYFHFPSWLS